MNAMQKEVLGEMRSRREKGKLNYNEHQLEDREEGKSEVVVKNKIYKKVELPDFQLYEQKETLIELLEKELNCNDDESLTPEEQELKERLLEQGSERGQSTTSGNLLMVAKSMASQTIKRSAKSFKKTSVKLNSTRKYFGLG